MPPTFPLDRRPRCFQTNIDITPTDPRRLNRLPGFLAGGAPFLFSSLIQNLNRGFLVPVLHMPQGNPDTAAGSPQATYSNSIWHILDPEFQTYLSKLPLRITELEFYTGFRLSSSARTPYYDTNTIPDLTNASHLSIWHDNWDPLLLTLQRQSIKTRTIWFDAASPSPASLVSLNATELRFRSGGEAFPITAAGSGPGPGGIVYNLDATHITLCPWHCSLDFFRAFSNGAPIPWSVNPTLTDCHVAVQWGDDPTLTELQSIAAAGFVIDIYGDVSDAIAADILTANGL